MKYFTIIIGFYLLISCFQSSIAQIPQRDSITRSNIITQSVSDSARKQIRLLPGFEIVANNNLTYLAVIDTTKRLSFLGCKFQIKSYQANGTESNVLRRVTPSGNSFDLLNISLITQNESNFNNSTISWTGPDNFSATTKDITVSKIGRYTVTISKDSTRCQFVRDIVSVPCFSTNDAYSCGNSVSIPNVEDDFNRRLRFLTRGDTIQAGNFKIIILDAIGNSANGWSGLGKVLIPYIDNNIVVKFGDIKINDCYQLITGNKVETVLNPNYINAVNLSRFTSTLKSQNRITAGLLDVFSIYNGSTLQNTKIESSFNSLEASVQNDFYLTDAQKEQISSTLNALKITFVELKNTPSCNTSGISNGKFSSEDSYEVCDAKLNTLKENLGSLYMMRQSFENTDYSNDFNELKYTFTHRSFAPWKRFGDLFGLFQRSFEGDNRGFSLLPSTPEKTTGKVTARIHQITEFDLKNSFVISSNRFSSKTIGYTNFISSSEDQAFADVEGTETTFKANKLITQMEGSDPLVAFGAGAPDIDWKAELRFKLLRSGSTNSLLIIGIINGKAFPAYEAFISDRTGNKVFLHTYPAPDRLQLAAELIPNIYDYSSIFGIKILIDNNGNFMAGSELLVSGSNPVRNISISDWNEENRLKTVAPDCERGECGK